MKRRTALKILNKECPSNYWDVWYNPKTNEYCGIPHSGKHWYMIIKASQKLGTLGQKVLDIYKEAINDIVKKI